MLFGPITGFVLSSANIRFRFLLANATDIEALDWPWKKPTYFQWLEKIHQFAAGNRFGEYRP